MNFQEILKHPLHPHPRMEEKLGVDEKHVIVDLPALSQVFEDGMAYKGIDKVKIFNELVDILQELVDIIDNTPQDIDSFTTQPAKRILEQVDAC